MSDPSSGNLPPGGSGKGSNAEDGASSVAPTIHDQPIRASAESLPDPDGWGTSSEPPIAGVPIKNAAAYADTALLPVYDPLASRPAASPIDGPTVLATGEAGHAASATAIAVPVTPAAATAVPVTQPLAAAQQDLPPYGAPIAGDPPSAGPFVSQAPPPPAVTAQAAMGSPRGPHAGAPSKGGIPPKHVLMLAGVVGGLFLLLGIVIGVVMLARPKPPPIAIETPTAATVEPAPSPPPEPAVPSPVPPPVPVVAPVARPKAKKDAGAPPASSAKPGASSTPGPSSSTAGPGGATGSDAGRRGGRKVPH